MTLITTARRLARTLRCNLRTRAPGRAIATVLCGMLVLTTASDAFAQRAFARRFPAPAAQPLTLKGDIVQIGNTNLTCPNPTTDAACQNAHNSATTSRNNDFAMTAYNADPDGTNINSSTAGLTLPAGSNVLFAGLYWAGTTATDTAGLASRATARLKGPTGGYTLVTATTTDGIGSAYQSFVDVTSFVSARGNGTYTVGNIGQSNGTGTWSGWTLVVVYGNAATGTLRNLSVFDGFVLGNGTPAFQDITISGFFTPISGVVNTNLGLVTYDGDRGQPDGGNSLEFAPGTTAGGNLGTFSPVFNDLNPQNDVWNSSITVPGASGTQASNNLGGRNGAWVNTLGLDIDNIKPNTPLPYGTQSATLRVRATSGDVNYPGVVTLATDAFEPEIITSFTKTAANDNGSGAFRPGDTLTYTIGLTNQGNDNSNDTRVSDPLPVGVTYVPGSLQVTAGANAGAKTDAAGDDQAEYDAGTRTIRFRVGAGANTVAGGQIAPAASTTVTFKVTIDANQANGSSLSNVATVDYVSGTSGQPGTGSTPPSTFSVTRDADVSITKTGPTSVQPGGTVTYTLVAANAGALAADGTTVTDDVPNALTGVAITCAASGGAVCPATGGLTDLTALAIPTFPAGSSVTFTITGTAPATGTLSNTATIAVPGTTTDPNTGNNTSATVTTTISAGAINAIDDTGSAPAAGGTAVANVLANDTLAGAPPTTANVTLAQVSSTSAGVTLDTGTGAVNVAAGTAAGTYTLTYRICETAAPGNCDTAIATVTVSAGVIVAANDDNTVSASGAAQVGIANVLANDTLGGATATTGTVVPSQLATSNAGVTLDTATGAVNVAGGTAAGVYTVDYRICETGVPANCADAVATVTVSSGAVVATADTGTTVYAGSGGQSVASVLVNDTLGGAQATPSNVVITAASAVPAGITFDTATGQVTVASTVAAGSYSFQYRICETAVPGNCATTTVTVPVATSAIVANNDALAPALNGASGGTTAGSVLGNDQLNGAPVSAGAGGNVVLTPGAAPTPAAGSITLNADGTVTVAAGTTAGSYLFPYTICEAANPSNCATAQGTVTVSAAPIVANPSSAGPVSGAAGGSNVANAVANDTLNGGPVTLGAGGNATLAPVTQGPLTVNADGSMDVAAGTPAGSYSVTYTVCEALNPSNCASSTVTVTVSAAALVAGNDGGGPVNGATGAANVLNVVDNDTVNGAQATLGAGGNAIVAPVSAGPLTLDSDGTIDVAPGTPAGTYVLTYSLCEALNPANCTTAQATVTVAAAPIVAQPDTLGPVVGATGGNAGSVIGNDTLDGQPVTLGAGGNATLAPVTTGPLTVNADGTVTVAANTPAGTYTVTYTVCEVLNPTNCATTTATVTVTAAPIVASNDTGGPVVGASGGVVPGVDVAGNDTVGGQPITLGAGGNATLAPVTTGPLTVNADGTVTVAASTPAGTYAVTYTVCEVLNPANCATATVSITVSAAAIVATNDTGGPVNGASGGVVPGLDVVANDTLNGQPVTLGGSGNATLAPFTTVALTVNADGSVTVAPNTVAGTYAATYQVCERLNPSNCATATVTVTVAAAAIVATDDTAQVRQNTPQMIGVLGNDALNGATPAAATVVVTIATQAGNGTARVNADGTVTYTPNANYSGADAFTYTVCEVLNPANCATARVAVTVPANVVNAVDDIVATPQSGPVVISVVGNDSSAGAPLNPASLALVGGPANGTVVVNTATGTLTYTPNRYFNGTDTFTYRICDRSTPTPACDTATVTVTVTAAAPQLRISKQAATRTVRVGDLVRYTVVLENTGDVPVTATLLDVPPAGFTFVDSSLSVDDTDDTGALAGTNPLRVTGIDIAIGQRATVTYVLRVGAGVGRGTHTNRASAIDALGNTVGNTGTTDVEVEGDALLETSLLVGTVFDDVDGNGVQGAGERGIPGVRIASVDGLVMETDGHGRYHLEGMDVGSNARGRNVILKVDAATLPAGTTFTTENPRVRRVTPGLPVRFDFGVRLPQATPPDASTPSGAPAPAATDAGDR